MHCPSWLREVSRGGGSAPARFECTPDVAGIEPRSQGPRAGARSKSDPASGTRWAPPNSALDRGAPALVRRPETAPTVRPQHPSLQPSVAKTSVATPEYPVPKRQLAILVVRPWVA